MNRTGRPLSIKTLPRAAKTESQAMVEWGIEAGALIKGAMQARNWGYAELAEALVGLGIKRSAAIINRRINRGNFSAGFMLACLSVLEDGIDNTEGAKGKRGSANATSRRQR